jgi:hypothetical protein
LSRFQFVDDHRGAFGVKRLCRVLEVSRSGFYRWLKAAPARMERMRADARLARRIRKIHKESDGTYGAPRVTAELKDAGIDVNHKRVERVMRRIGNRITPTAARQDNGRTDDHPAPTVTPHQIAQQSPLRRQLLRQL